MPGCQIGDRALQPFDGNGEEEMRGHHQRQAVHREQRVEPRYRFDFGERYERNDDPRSEMVQYVRLATEQQAATGSARIDVVSRHYELPLLGIWHAVFADLIVPRFDRGAILFLPRPFARLPHTTSEARV